VNVEGWLISGAESIFSNKKEVYPGRLKKSRRCMITFF
jgi:hypothetical protein